MRTDGPGEVLAITCSWVDVVCRHRDFQTNMILAGYKDGEPEIQYPFASRQH